MPPSRLQTLADYDRIRESVRLDLPECFNFGHDVVDRWAQLQPDAGRLWWVGEAGGERVPTFAEVASRLTEEDIAYRVHYAEIRRVELRERA